MKKRYNVFVISVVGLLGVCSMGQELVTSPKNKKKYVSEQQYIELEGDIIVSTNRAIRACVDLLNNITAIQKESLSTINEYVDNEKDCFLQRSDKVKRTERYAKKIKIMQKLDRYYDKMHKMQQQLDVICTDIETSISN